MSGAIPRTSILLLASRSPRRKAILRFAGLRFRVVKPLGVREVPKPGESPSRLVRRLALEKALSVSRKNPGAWVLGADTIVARHNRILGKPKDPSQARGMLRRLQGGAHVVWTGVALVGRGGKKAWSSAERTKVFFRKLSDSEIDLYVRTKEPYDKAGAYAIQGTARHWVRRWEGDYFNVMGLPLQWVLRHWNRLSQRGR